jgi:tetratricopeptide (TPR) repeat protein
VSSLGISASSLLSYVKSAIFNPDYHIHSYVTEQDTKLSMTVWGLTPDHRLVDYTTHLSNNAEDIAVEAAENIKHAYDPFLLASYLFNNEIKTNTVNHAGSLAIVHEVVGDQITNNRNPYLTLVTDEERARAYNLWGLILVDQGNDKIKEAINKYRTAIDWASRKEPTVPWPPWRLTLHNEHVAALAYANWGDALRRLGDLEEAIEKYQKSNLWSTTFQSVYSDWEKQESADDTQKDLKSAEDTIARNSEDVDAHISRCRAIHISRCRAIWLLSAKDEAIECVEDLLNGFSSRKFDISLIYRDLLYESARYKDAEDKIRGALSINATSVDAWRLFGQICKKQNLYKEAEDATKHVIELLHPEDRLSFQ